MREMYGALILFFYFLKWPIFIVMPIMYYNGLQNNWIINIVWALCLVFIVKDFYILLKNRNKK